MFLLQHVLGKSSKIIYAIALLASGQSSAITGTYAGQYIMQVFISSFFTTIIIIIIKVIAYIYLD